jgi:4-hydroxyphenylpyruvate dioxygenase
VDYYSGAGVNICIYIINNKVQHIALKTDNIIREVEALKSRGVDFLSIPDTYYDNLRKNLPHMNVKVDEDINIL